MQMKFVPYIRYSGCCIPTHNAKLEKAMAASDIIIAITKNTLVNLDIDINL